MKNKNVSVSEDYNANSIDDDDEDDDDDDDIYIMMKCLCVTNHHFLSARAERQRREARRLLGLAGHRPTYPPGGCNKYKKKKL